VAVGSRCKRETNTSKHSCFAGSKKRDRNDPAPKSCGVYCRPVHQKNVELLGKRNELTIESDSRRTADWHRGTERGELSVHFF